MDKDIDLTFRPPAVPLITCDPYFSIWSMADRLTHDMPRHWTGKIHALTGMVRIDGKTYRFMGSEPRNVSPIEQVGLRVMPTRTIYEFQADGIRLTVIFTTPLLPHNLDILARPVGYITWRVRSLDGCRHNVSLYYDNTGELVVNTPDQEITWSRQTVGGCAVLRMGTSEQPVLEKDGDDLRIDWGYLYAASPEDDTLSQVIASHRSARDMFAESGELPEGDDVRMPRPANDDYPVLAFAFNLGDVGDEVHERHLILAYDDLFSIEYLGAKLRPYWRRKGMDANELIIAAERDYGSISAQCETFDQELISDLTEAGGESYSQIASLAYRQCIAAHKLAVCDEKPLLFPKENFSNGCISTVDVIYPSSPLFLLLNPELSKAQLTPILEYARSQRWRFPFAPHDLGRYPKANGQVYGGGEASEENQMPVEESGNMLILVAAIAKAEGNADYALEYWELLSKWAAYLKEKGLDPEEQLCTDDFAGHLAHNTNLSLKAILALGAYADLCEMVGKTEEASTYRRIAEEFALKWVEMADDGDHYRLAFDKPGTWSQKYNLVWDRILGLDLFPQEVARKELDFYKAKLNRFGLPLDNRKEWTKLDWEIWSSSLTESLRDFESLISPVYDFANESPSRVPLTDWYWTTDSKQLHMQARSVVGGVYIRMLFRPEIWKKWVKKAKS